MKTILIVDDNKDITSLFKTILESSGYKCTSANGGKEGLELMHKSSFDLVLLDLAMPEMSGIDVLEAVKSSPNLKSNKILMITASSPDDHDINKIKNDYSVLDIVRKPIDKKNILQIIEKY